MSELKIVECLAEERKIIGEGINEYNLGQVPSIISGNYISFDYVVKNIQQEVIAGILAGMGYWGGLEIKHLWVRENQRQLGIGTKLLNEVEKNAKAKGAIISLLDTFDFQAKDFYLKNGYTIFGQVNNFPIGHKRYYLQKQL